MALEPAEIDYTQPSPLEERLVAYLDGELDDAEVREVEELLATDPKARELLADLERTWALLDQLTPRGLDELFARTTIKMVSMAAADDLARQQSEIPRRRRRQWWIGAGCILGAALAGFLAVAWLWPDPNRQLLQDLPVLEDLDELQHVFNKDDDIAFLRLLQQEGLFVADAPDEP